MGQLARAARTGGADPKQSLVGLTCASDDGCSAELAVAVLEAV